MAGLPLRRLASLQLHGVPQLGVGQRDRASQGSPASAFGSQSLCLKTPAAALGDGSTGSPLDLTPSPGKGGVGGSMSLIFD